MRESWLDDIRNRLQVAGIAPAGAARMIAELDDHLEDLVEEGRRLGLDAKEARQYAMQRLGAPEQIAAQASRHDELKTWSGRHPQLARVYLPFAYVVLLPLAPIFAGAANAGIVLRWGASLMLAGAVTALMMLALQLSIALT